MNKYIPKWDLLLVLNKYSSIYALIISISSFSIKIRRASSLKYFYTKGKSAIPFGGIDILRFRFYLHKNQGHMYFRFG